MKTTLPHFFILLSLVFMCRNTLAQEFVTEVLNVNHVFTKLNSDGSMYNTENQDGAFIVPNIGDLNKASTLFTGNLWMAGIDDGLNLNASYGAFVNNSYTPGMLDQITGEPHDDPLMSQDRVWNISKSNIELHFAQLALGKTEGLDRDIMEWPAKGNPHYNGLMDDRDGAPFVDSDNDGIYNPLIGDFPNINSDIDNVVPDQMLLAVTNDKAMNVFNPLGVEIYTMLYAFYCEENEDVNNSVFQKHLIYNRSESNYTPFRLGLFFDPDLGCSEDDYIGCDTTANLFYIYNQDEVDGDAANLCTTGASTFEDSPVHITKLLSGELSSFMYYGRSGFGVGTIPSEGVEVNTPSHIFNLCGGVWANGIHLTQGGSGYNPGSVDSTKHAFHGNINDLNSWTMINEETSSDDFRVLAGLHFQNLLSQECLEVDLVHTYVQSDNHDHLQTIDLAKEKASIVEDFYFGDFTSCSQIASCNTVDCLAPGDVNNNEKVERTDFMLLSAALNKAGGFESPRSFISDLWKLYEAGERNEELSNGVNFIHADCNGDGLITSDDFDAIHKNAGIATQFYDSHEENCVPYEGGGRFVLDPFFPAIQSTDSFYLTSTLGIENFESIYCLSFNLSYDAAMTLPEGQESLFLAGFGIGSPNFSLVQTSQGREELTFRLSDQGDVDVEFQQCFLGIKLTGESNLANTKIRIHDILIMDYDENFYCMDDTEFIIDFTDVSSVEELDRADFQVFPNPASNRINLLTNSRISRYQLFDISGRLVLNGDQKDSNVIDISTLKQGVYFLECLTVENKRYKKRIVISR